MSWAFGIENGKEVGYSVDDTCNLKECDKEIDRGIDHRCGGVSNLHDDFGCGNFFCARHVNYTENGQLCNDCYVGSEYEKEQDENDSCQHSDSSEVAK